MSIWQASCTAISSQKASCSQNPTTRAALSLRISVLRASWKPTASCLLRFVPTSSWRRRCRRGSVKARWDFLMNASDIPDKCAGFRAGALSSSRFLFWQCFWWGFYIVSWGTICRWSRSECILIAETLESFLNSTHSALTEHINHSHIFLVWGVVWSERAVYCVVSAVHFGEDAIPHASSDELRCHRKGWKCYVSLVCRYI